MVEAEEVEVATELDEGRLVSRIMLPMLEARLDRIVKEVVGKFKGGSLSQDNLTQLRADWLATSRLMAEVKGLTQGGQ